jgi:hypothetical protein
MGSGVGALVGSSREAALVLEREESSSVSIWNESGQKYLGCIAEALSDWVEFVDADGDSWPIVVGVRRRGVEGFGCEGELCRAESTSDPSEER